MKGEDRITPSRENCVYTSCYCEENVWKLCEFVRLEKTAPLEELFVVFISNENRMVPLWKQKSGRGDQPVIWVCDIPARLTILMSQTVLNNHHDVIMRSCVFQDYHVVLLQVGLQSDTLLYDLDSELSFPCSLKLYANQALRSDHHINPTYHRKLRVVPADSFLLNFASDRSHMRNSDGSWRMPPPPYPPIQTTETQMNLDDFISMNPAVGWGAVLSLDHFLQRFMAGSSSSSTSSTAASS
uniref:protein N-terminal glutamine amidohydrolase isoform X1 n=2 Tax=Semicossyphus pulcher TaxID=241346 RepID=UPI0037E85C61